MVEIKKAKRQPGHPGDILKRRYLEPLGLTVSSLARSLGVSRKTVSKIVNENGAITADMALRLSRAFDTTPQLWLNLQQNHDIWQASNKSRGWKDVEKIAA